MLKRLARGAGAGAERARARRSRARRRPRRRARVGLTGARRAPSRALRPRARARCGRPRGERAPRQRPRRAAPLDRGRGRPGQARARPSAVARPRLRRPWPPCRHSPWSTRWSGIRRSSSWRAPSSSRRFPTPTSRTWWSPTACVPGARGHRRRAAAPRRRDDGDLRRLPRAALDRARPDEGRHPLRPGGVARRVRGARDVDDVEVRAAAAAVRRREGRHPLRPARADAARARAPHAPLHVGARARDRPADRHPGAGHGDERADDGVDDGHVLDADGPRRAGGRHRQADLRRRLDLPPRGDGRRRRDDRRARVPSARLEARHAALRRPGLRQRRRRCCDGAARAGRNRDRRLGRLRRPLRAGGLDIPALHAYVVEHGSLEGYAGARQITNEELLELPCDVFIVAAREDQLTARERRPHRTRS